MATKKPVMPPECCGNCRFSHDVRGQTFLLCMVQPPFPVMSQEEDNQIDWLRGGATEPNDPRCFYWQPKTGVN